MLFNKQLDKTLRVCPHCGHHFRISARTRVEQLVDAGTFVERDSNLQPIDSLEFVDLKAYPDRLLAAQLSTGLRDAAIWGTAVIGGKPVSLCVMDFFFIGGSMGPVVGEKITRAGEAALADRIPLIIVSASGGARMQEGTYSLMQLVKTMSVVERVKAACIPYISILTDPTTGGVFASFAVVGDVNIAEPNALIRFAGDRVSAGTIGEELPTIPRAEFWFSHGFVDRVVPRAKLRDELSALLGLLVAPAVAAQGESQAGGPQSLGRSIFSAITGALGADSGSEPKAAENGQTRGEVSNG
jgi:acetyl-CoA carboxylase carboxyl transferase subunit beta